tara:strand:- start:268 stop:390 length:123 start_codon:yes stop_codon:yes gene_type:complete
MDFKNILIGILIGLFIAVVSVSIINDVSIEIEIGEKIQDE